VINIEILEYQERNFNCKFSLSKDIILVIERFPDDNGGSGPQA
jgi:hypothetical protein